MTGSVGEGGVSGAGTLWVDVKPTAANQAVKVLMNEGQVLPLPLDKAVVEIKGETADGKPIRQTFKLKISE